MISFNRECVLVEYLVIYRLLQYGPASRLMQSLVNTLIHTRNDRHQNEISFIE